MIDIYKKIYIVETRWDKTIKNIHLQIDSPSLYHYTARTEVYEVITNAYAVNNNYSIVEVSNVLKN